jgi:uncharacterized protein (TIGR02246 family)
MEGQRDRIDRRTALRAGGSLALGGAAVALAAGQGTAVAGQDHHTPAKIMPSRPSGMAPTSNRTGAQRPADVNRLIAEAISRGDRAAALALLEAESVFVPQPGQVVHGTSGIAAALDGFLALTPTLDIQVIEVIEVGEIALLRSTWTLNGTGPDGQPLQLGGAATDVVRRAADGTWRYVIDHPWGGIPPVPTPDDER